MIAAEWVGTLPDVPGAEWTPVDTAIAQLWTEGEHVVTVAALSSNCWLAWDPDAVGEIFATTAREAAEAALVARDAALEATR